MRSSFYSIDPIQALLSIWFYSNNIYKISVKLIYPVYFRIKSGGWSARVSVIEGTRTSSGDSSRGSSAEVADLEHQPHRRVQRNPLITCQSQDLQSSTPTHQFETYMATSFVA